MNRYITALCSTILAFFVHANNSWALLSGYDSTSFGQLMYTIYYFQGEASRAPELIYASSGSGGDDHDDSYGDDDHDDGDDQEDGDDDHDDTYSDDGHDDDGHDDGDSYDDDSDDHDDDEDDHDDCYDCDDDHGDDDHDDDGDDDDHDDGEDDRNYPPLCDAGVSYTASCTGATTEVILDGSGSFDVDRDQLYYVWSSNCPGATFSDATLSTPTMIFNSENSDHTAVSCKVTLSVNDGRHIVGCEASVTVGVCTHDCNGSIGGTAALDVCGVCNGNGTSCLDCLNVPFGTATKDRCGVCAGDGNSCLGCAEATNISDLLVTLDGGSRSLKSYARQAAKTLKRLTGSPADSSVKKLLTRVNAAQIEAWTFINSVPRTISQCQASPRCVQTSTAGPVQSYLARSEELRKIVNKIARKIRRTKAKGSAQHARKFTTLANTRHNQNVMDSAKIPGFTSQCS